MGISSNLWPNAIKCACMPIAVFPLLNVPCVSYSDDEDTTLRIVLHFVLIVPFLLGLGFTYRSEVQLQLLSFGMVRYAVS